MKNLIINTIEQINILRDKFIDDENNAYIYMLDVIKMINAVFNPVIRVLADNKDIESQKWIENCRKKFKLLEECIEKRDTIGIIDVLCYEIKMIMEELGEVVG